ncbi:MAG: phosphatidylserine decarboxylase [Oscillospiraceae bacterium]|nr:phosphatidylserine decarboxylase [Oscillospiraceae bacterium]
MVRTRDGRNVSANERQNAVLKKLYGTVWGRLLLKILTAPAVSEIVGAFMDSPLSKPFVSPFIRSHNIDTSQYIMTGVRSYNDFFTRKIKPQSRQIDMEKSHLISPCDSKLTVYRVDKDSLFRIKNSLYSIADLLNSKKLAERYSGGLCLIFRLEVDDYHRYCYIDSGTKTENWFIAGELHTVNPIALKHYNIYKRNCREYTMLRTENFGDVIQAEVGAMMVGRIVNHHGKASFRRGEEKGMFMFGGSTVVLLIERGRAVIDADIVRNSASGIETVVKYGEKIGAKA